MDAGPLPLDTIMNARDADVHTRRPNLLRTHAAPRAPRVTRPKRTARDARHISSCIGDGTAIQQQRRSVMVATLFCQAQRSPPVLHQGIRRNVGSTRHGVVSRCTNAPLMKRPAS